MKVENSSKTYEYREAGVDYIEVVDTVVIETESIKDDIGKEETNYRNLGYLVVGTQTDRHYWDKVVMNKTRKEVVSAPKAEREFDSDDCSCHLIGEICGSCAERA